MKRVSGGLVIAMVIGACAGADRVHDPSSVVPWPASDGPLTFAPRSESAARYNDPIAAPPPNALGDAIVAAMRDVAVQTGTEVPTADARLFRACSELAPLASDRGGLPYSLVEFALQRNGIIEPSPQLLVVTGDVRSPQGVIAELRPRLPALLAGSPRMRIGVGSVQRSPDGQGTVILALLASRVTTSPIPRAFPAGGRFAFDVSVDAQLHRPEVRVVRQDGSVERIALQRTDTGALTAQVDCGDAIGKQQIGIEAGGGGGADSLANFPVWCGSEPPRSWTFVPSSDDRPVRDAAAAERRMFALINADRERAGLPPLAWDDGLMLLARSHSEEMRKARAIANAVPTTGNIVDRVYAGRRDVIAHANVGLAYSIREMDDGFMNLPSVRAVLRSSSLTSFAIGAALGDEIAGRRELFMTTVATQPRTKIDPAQAAEQARQCLAAVRPLRDSPALDTLAQALAAESASGSAPDPSDDARKRRIHALRGQYARVTTVSTVVIALDTLDCASLLGDAHPDDIGVGIAQGPHAKLGDDAIFIALLLATRR